MSSFSQVVSITVRSQLSAEDIERDKTLECVEIDYPSVLNRGNDYYKHIKKIINSWQKKISG